MKIEEITAKSILVASKLPDADYVVNPYTGCQFGCLYCYATFMGRFVNEPRSNWGNYVYVKANAVEIIRSELKKWSAEKRLSKVLLSSVTDPYHGIEEKYRLTRGILEVFVEEKYPGCVSILTKSPMVLRDVDLLKELPNVDVGMTITTTDDKLSRFLEVTAPLASRRFDTLAKLNEQGIPTYAFVGPLLPHFRYHPELLDKLFAEIAATGVKEIYVEHINLPAYIKERLWSTLQHESKEIQQVYEGAKTQIHRDALTEMVNKLVEKYKLHIRLEGAIYHQELEQAGKKSGDVDVKAILDGALQTKGVVRIGYEDFNGNVTERDIAPYEWNDFDQKKLTAFCYLRNDERNFSVSKIQWAEYVGSVDNYVAQRKGIHE